MRGNKSGLYFGSVEFSGVGGYREKMLSELLESGISVRNVRMSEVGITGEVSPFDYFRVASAARRNGVEIRAGKRRGLYFMLSKYRTRAGLYVGLLVFIMALSVWQTRVRDISITGDVSKTQVMEILESCGIREGAAVAGLQVSMAEHRIMLEVDNCSWVDVSCEGFRVNVQIKKGTEPPEIESDQPRNIVAARPAMIVSQTVRNGASVVGTGSGVNTGDLLVSGVFPDGGGHILTVRADAEMIGEWEESTEFFVPYSEIVNVPDGAKKTFKYLIYRDDVYPLFIGRAFAENSVYSEETSPLKILGAETPFYIRTGTFTAYTQKTITRSPEAAAAELTKQRETYETNFYDKFDVISYEEKFFPEDDGVRLIVDYVLQGDIARPVDIEFDNTDITNHEMDENQPES